MCSISTSYPLFLGRMFMGEFRNIYSVQTVEYFFLIISDRVKCALMQRRCFCGNCKRPTGLDSIRIPDCDWSVGTYGTSAGTSDGEIINKGGCGAVCLWWGIFYPMWSETRLTDEEKDALEIIFIDLTPLGWVFLRAIPRLFVELVNDFTMLGFPLQGQLSWKSAGEELRRRIALHQHGACRLIS